MTPTLDLPEPKDTGPLINIDAEKITIGAMMADNRIVDRIADIVSAEDFSQPFLAHLFNLIMREVAASRPANPVTMRPHVADYPGIAELGPGKVLAELTGSGAVLIGSLDIAKQVHNLAVRRRLVAGLTATVELATSLADEASIDALVEIADEALAAASELGDSAVQVSAAQALGDVIARYGKPLPGVLSGISAIDRLMGPLRPKQLVIGAGRPGMGKTAVAISYAIGAAALGHATLFVSLEMSRDELAERMAADMCFSGSRGVSYDAIMTGELSRQDMRDVLRARDRLEELPIHILDVGRLTIGALSMRVRRNARRMAARGEKLELVIVDYLQLVSGDGKPRSAYETISEVSRGMKAIAKEHDVTVLALAQLSREVEKRADKRPVLSDLRDSGQIEQDADGVMFLYRHEYYLRQAEPEDDKRSAWEDALQSCQGRIEFICAKRRAGRTGRTEGMFHAEYQAVRD